MIECDRCKKEISIEEIFIECVESEVVDIDQTQFCSNGDIRRFCKKCWDEMITFLLGEGQL
jgi:hypothetical protein